jgi:putative hydrolase of HD superfamily
MMIYLLKEYSNEDFDVAKAMMMAIIHDIVEIDAGDTYAYDTKALKAQKKREEKAAERIFGMLPNDQREELRALFEKFEAGESPEARFAKVMDNFQPLLLNDSNGGADWREHHVTKSKVVGRQQTSSRGSEEIWKYTEELINVNVEKGNIIDK